MRPGVAQCLWSLAPSLAPRDLVSGANLRMFGTSPSYGEVAAIERLRSTRAGPARRLAIGPLSAVMVTLDHSVDGSLLGRGSYPVRNRAARISVLSGRREKKGMARWTRGEQTVQFLIDRSRLESFEAEDLTALTDALIVRTARRVETTAAAALAGGDVDGAYVAAYDAYRMAAEALLARQGLRATGGDGSHMAVEDAVSAQFARDIPAFAKPTFERFRRTRHSAQYFDPSAAPISRPDASWAIEKATAALSGARDLLAASPPERFS
jgi:hypothetical protein